MKNRYLALLIVVLQCWIIFFAFKPFILNPNHFIFANIYDGLKNYHTLNSYVLDSAGKDAWRYRMMNYPFGDVVMYADNTPAFAIPYKIITTAVPGCADYAIGVFNLLLLLNFVVSSLLTFFILKRFIKNRWLLVIIPVTWVWLQPMSARLQEGHYNLSLSWLILLNLLLLIRAFDYRQSVLKSAGMASGISLLVLFSYFVHGYYLFILGFFTAYFYLFTAIIEKRPKELIKAVVVPLIPIMLVLWLNYSIDPDIDTRKKVIENFGFEDWHMHTLALFTPYDYSTFRFFKTSAYPYNFETKAYLGSAFIIGLLFFIGYQLSRKQILKRWKSAYNSFADARLLIILALSALFMLLISIGEKGYIFDTGHHFTNILNPFLYLRPFVPQLSNLRCLARFQFPFYFVAFIFFALLLDRYYTRFPNLFMKGFVGLLIALLMLDAYDAIRFIPALPNVFNKDTLAEVSLPVQNTSQYQAILPIPYFHVGSEESGYTIETDDAFFDRTLRISTLTNLPLMSCKMSRTPVYQVRALDSLFLSDAADSRIMAKLNEKPILVIVDKTNSNPDCANCKKPVGEPALSVFGKERDLPATKHMQLLAEDGSYAYYSWNIK